MKRDKAAKWLKAIGSRRRRKDVTHCRDGFAVFQAVGQDSERQDLHACNRFFACLSVGKDAGQDRDFGQPAPIVFLFDFDCEGHHASRLALQERPLTVSRLLSHHKSLFHKPNHLILLLFFYRSRARCKEASCRLGRHHLFSLS